MDQRVCEALMMEDPEIIMDLRQIQVSVHERRHGMVTFIAKAISEPDLIEIEKLCLADIPIPSEPWVHLNFCPRTPHTQVAKRHTGHLEAKHMIQKHQFRKSHLDSHYCAAIFRYMRDYVIKYRDRSVSMTNTVLRLVNQIYLWLL